MQLLRNAFFVLPATGLALGTGCKAQEPMVFVLAGEQQVTLTSSASTTRAKQGEQVVLHLQRRSVGEWQKIPRNQLKPGQCWLYTPPPELEQEVADNADWQVEPENAVRFDTTFRMDHTRIATMMQTGTIVLTPVSPVRCEKDRVVAGPAVRIEVT